MTGRLRALPDDELGRALSSVDLDWPPAPDLAPAVMAAVRAPQPARVIRLPMSRRARILLIAAATALLLTGAAVAAKLVIDLGAVVVRVPEDAGTLPTSSPPSFGEPIGLEEAGHLIGTEVGFPARLGRPHRVWADEVINDAGTVVRITLAWRPSADLPPVDGIGYGAVLMRFEGDSNQASKEVYEGTGTLEPVRVGDEGGFWTTGPHLLELLTSEGVRFVRVEGNVLLWSDGPYTLRLETALPKGKAVRIAASIPGTA